MKIYKQIVGNHSCGYVIKGIFRDRKIAEKTYRDVETFMKILQKFDDEDIDEKNVLREVTDFLKIRGYNFKHSIEGIDWEDDPMPQLEGKNVIVGLYTSGDGVDEIANIMKKNKGKVLIADENDIKEY